MALVLENVATYHSVLATVPYDGPVGLVIFGGGGNFAASVCYLTELAAEGPASSVREIRYFGDLDRRGLEIPIAADSAARSRSPGGSTRSRTMGQASARGSTQYSSASRYGNCGAADQVASILASSCCE